MEHIITTMNSNEFKKIKWQIAKQQAAAAKAKKTAEMHEYFSEVYQQIRDYMDEKQHFVTAARDYEVTIVEDCGKSIMIRLMDINGNEKFNTCEKDYFVQAVREARLQRYNGPAFFKKDIPGEKPTSFHWDFFRMRKFDPEVGEWEHLDEQSAEESFLNNGQTELRFTRESELISKFEDFNNKFNEVTEMAYEAYEREQKEDTASKLAQKFNTKKA